MNNNRLEFKVEYSFNIMVTGRGHVRFSFVVATASSGNVILCHSRDIKLICRDHNNTK